MDIAIYLTIRSILLDSDRHGSIPANSGLFRPITITAPEGWPANPALPGADDRPLLPREHRRRHRDARTGAARTRQRQRRRRQPEGRRVLRPQQRWPALGVHGHPGGSYGGRSGKDGLDAVDTLYANTRNNPIEDIESHYPLRVTRYELNVDTGGAGAGGRARHDPRDRVPRARRNVARGRRLRAPAARAVRRRGWDARARRDQPTRRERRRGAVEVPVPRDAGRRSALPRRAVGRRLRASGRPRPGRIREDVADEVLSRERARQLYGFEE